MGEHAYAVGKKKKLEAPTQSLFLIWNKQSKWADLSPPDIERIKTDEKQGSLINMQN